MTSNLPHLSVDLSCSYVLASIESRRDRAVDGPGSWSPNNALQRADHHKQHGRGRLTIALNQVMRARVLKRRRAVAERGRWATS
jgi:hypothetical protein